MLLSSYLSTLLSNSSPNLRKQRRKVQLSLQAYYGDRYSDVSLLELALPESIDGYITFLTDTYEGGGADSSQKDDHESSARGRRAVTHITILRSIIGTAIADGLFPVIDPFTKYTAYRRRQAVTSAVPLIDALSRLAAAISVPAVKVYIACLALGGIDLSTLNTVVSGDTPLEADEPTSPLIDSLRDFADEHSDWLPALTPGAIATDLNTHGIRCLAAGDIFTDWCLIASQSSLVTPKQLAAAIRWHIYSDADSKADADQAIDRVATYIIGRTVNPEIVQRQHWAVVCANWPNTAERIERRILRDDTLAPLLTGNIYCPCHTPAPRHGAPRPATDPYRATLRSTLFVRATDATLNTLRQHIPDMWIMRHRNASTYTRIPPAQLNLMRHVLNLLGTPEEISIDLGDTPAPLEPLTKDELVHFTHPFFGDNITATVLGRVPSTDHYKLRFTSSGKTITLTLPRQLIVPSL